MLNEQLAGIACANTENTRQVVAALSHDLAQVFEPTPRCVERKRDPEQREHAGKEVTRCFRSKAQAAALTQRSCSLSWTTTKVPGAAIIAAISRLSVMMPVADASLASPMR